MQMIFVETPTGVERNRLPDSVFVTDNPVLAQASVSQAVINADGLLSQEEANALGALGLELANRVDLAFKAHGEKTFMGVPACELRMAGVTSRLFSGLLHRAEALRRVLHQVSPDAIILRVTDQPRFEPSQPLLPPRFASPARALSEAGFFADVQVKVELVDFTPPQNINETAASDTATRAMILPKGVISHEVSKWLNFNWQRSKGTVFVAGQNEVIREALPFLVRKGFNLEYLGKLMTGPPADRVTFDQPAPYDDEIVNIAGPVIDAQLTESTCFEPHQRTAISRLLCQHLCAGIAKLESRRRLINQRIAAITQRDANNAVIISNGLFGPYGALAYHAAKRNGAVVVDVEHGVTTGLSALSVTKIDYSEAATSDILLCSSRRSAEAFAMCDRPNPPKIEIVGLADQTRKLYRPRFQRYWARRRLGIGHHDTVLMHVSTMPYFGNLRPGLSSPTETTTFDLEKHLIEDVYSRTPHRVLYKPYPTQRFPFEPPLRDIIDIPGNVGILADEDFRYIRAAADIIVSMTPSSTLGWCVGLDRPFIWLHTDRYNRLVDSRLAKCFEDAFLFVDLDQKDWRRSMQELLSKPLSELKQLWQDKSSARAHFLENDICGPTGNVGMRAADIIAEVAENR